MPWSSCRLKCKILLVYPSYRSEVICELDDLQWLHSAHGETQIVTEKKWWSFIAKSINIIFKQLLNSLISASVSKLQQELYI